MIINKRRYLVILMLVMVISALGGGLVSGAVIFSLYQPKTGALVSSNVETTTPTSTPESMIIQLSTTDVETTITGSVQTISPSVVTVLGVIQEETTFFNQAAEQEVSGSGVIISADGYILTNNHVVEGTDQVSIVLADGKEVAADIVGTDEFADLAVLWTDPAEVPGYAVIGNSDNLSPGETVIAIGSPLGRFKNTVTVGVVSATERMLRINENYQMEGLIQTDAAINQGNSGGPLVNLAGEVVGINTLIVRGGNATNAEGLGFAIPSNMARAVAQQIIQQGFFARPYMGIRWETISPPIAQMYNLPVNRGIYVTYVIPGTPADLAGIQRGDIIVSFGNLSLDENTPFINTLYNYSPGETVQLEIIHSGQTEIIELILGDQPEFQ